MASVAEKYEQERLANIAENQRILAALFSNTMGQAPSVPSLPSGPVISFGHGTPKPKPKPKAARPRPSVTPSAAGGSPSSSVAEGSTPGRRSARNSGKRVNYTKEIVRAKWDPTSDDEDDQDEDADGEGAVLGKRKRQDEDEYENPEGDWLVPDGEGDEEEEAAKRQRREYQKGRPVVGGMRGSGHGVKVGKRNNDPKTFGHIPGIAVGTWWPTRMAVSKAAIHAPPVGGIAGNATVGCWSIALSGGWADDVDNGELFTYTGSGGTNLSGTAKDPKNLRVAPQSFNQSFDHPPNASLKRSCETGKPVRVLRGYKNPSEFAPKDGYRYDGLYVVTRAWEAPSIANPKLTVCRYALQRLGGQGEIGVKQDRAQLESDGVETEAPGEVEVKEEEASEVVAPNEDSAPVEAEMAKEVKEEEESDPVVVAEEGADVVADVEVVPAAEAEGAAAPPSAAAPAAEEIAIVRTEEPASDVVVDEAVASADEVAPIVVAEEDVVAPVEVEPATKAVETEKSSAGAEDAAVVPPAEDVPVAGGEEEQDQEGASLVEVPA